MSSLFELLFKKPLFVGAVALILGIIIGIPIGWNTVTVVNTTPDVLRFDLQEDYLRMAIDSSASIRTRTWPSSAGTISEPLPLPLFPTSRKTPAR